MITHNKIVKFLNDIATNHLMINGFGFGDPWEYLANSTPQTVCLWGIDLEHSINKSQENGTSILSLNYKILVFDLVDKGEDVEDYVLSDTLQIALDVLAIMDYKANSEDYSFSYSTVKPFTERFDSEVSGHEVDITFRVPLENNICQIPLTSIPTI
jgi:hypothetical protein